MLDGDQQDCKAFNPDFLADYEDTVACDYPVISYSQNSHLLHTLPGHMPHPTYATRLAFMKLLIFVLLHVRRLVSS